MCGVIGVSRVPEAARIAYLGLYALQHRGQESAGIAAITADGTARVHRGMGLVSETFDEKSVASLPGDVDRVLAIGLAKKPEHRFDTALELARWFALAIDNALDPEQRRRGDEVIARYPWGTRPQ